MAFNAGIAAGLEWKWTAGAKDWSKLTFEKKLAERTGDLETKVVWHVEDQVIASGEDVLHDLTALTRTVLGDATHTIAMDKVYAIAIVNTGTTGVLTVGNAPYDEWHEPFGAAGDTLVIPPGSPALLANYLTGWPVVDEGDSSSSSSGETGASRMLLLSASVADVTYSIAILGAKTEVTDSSSSGA